jgi:hypothetical protein
MISTSLPLARHAFFAKFKRLGEPNGESLAIFSARQFAGKPAEGARLNERKCRSTPQTQRAFAPRNAEWNVAPECVARGGPLHDETGSERNVGD